MGLFSCGGAVRKVSECVSELNAIECVDKCTSTMKKEQEKWRAREIKENKVFVTPLPVGVGSVAVLDDASKNLVDGEDGDDVNKARQLAGASRQSSDCLDSSAHFVALCNTAAMAAARELSAAGSADCIRSKCALRETPVARAAFAAGRLAGWLAGQPA